MPSFKLESEQGRKPIRLKSSKAMRTVKDSNGERLFSYEDFLTSQQISSYLGVTKQSNEVTSNQERSNEKPSNGKNIERIKGLKIVLKCVKWFERVKIKLKTSEACLLRYGKAFRFVFIDSCNIHLYHSMFT